MAKMTLSAFLLLALLLTLLVEYDVSAIGPFNRYPIHHGHYDSNEDETTTPIVAPKRPRSCHRSRLKALLAITGGFGGGGGAGLDVRSDDNDGTKAKAIEIHGSKNSGDILDGLYTKAEDINGRCHFEKLIEGDPKGTKIHLYWSSNQWILHYDRDPSKNFEGMLAYAKVREQDPLKTSPYWNVRSGKAYLPRPQFTITKPGAARKLPLSAETSSVPTKSEEFMGVPRQLFPLYMAFMLDAIAVGLAMPLLPFYVMELGANALQLSMVVSSTYVAQTIGCIVMGRVSDRYGRKIVLFMCLAASSLSYFCVSKARTLTGVALARIIAGSFGGLVPVMQSCVADVSSQDDRPKYLGRIMATFGMGFVLGPAVSALAAGFSTRHKIRLSGLLPLTGLAIAVLFFRETKTSVLEANAHALTNANTAINQQPTNSKKISVAGSPHKIHIPSTNSHATSHTTTAKTSPPVESAVMLLVLNGFLLMYAFATETIYAMFMKDSFGYGERALSTLFAMNGFFIGIMQVFFIKPLIGTIGKHGTLAFGNLLLALGMVGVALVRKETLHFMLFAAHIVGYSIADTALASLISRYSAPATQGRDLAFNQAAQSCARVISPLFAGLLYEKSKQSGTLPVGALPFLAGAAFPAIGISIPALLYIRSVSRKRAEAEKSKND
jgi:MFS family permease